MPGFIGLFKWTQQGVGTVKEAPDRIKRSRTLAEQMGIRTVGVWITMGEYDLAGVFDAPDDQAMATFMLAVASQGNVSTQTVRAFSEDEFAQVVGRLP